MKNKLNWYALYTKPRSEKRVKERLEILEAECYLPLHNVPRVWSDRVKRIDVPLFSSYIFVRCEEAQVYRFITIEGVVRVVFYDHKPAIIKQSEIDAMKTFIEKAAGRTLCTGEEVRILAGSMKNISGKITKIKKKYIVLRIEQLSATVCVNTEMVAPVK